MEPLRIRTNVQVMFFDTDCGGVVSNIAYLRFIEIARTHLAEELGLAVVEMAQKETYPVVVRTEIDYRRAARLGDRLVIEAGWIALSARGSGAHSASRATRQHVDRRVPPNARVDRDADGKIAAFA
jgi:Predicted thioesterase